MSEDYTKRDELIAKVVLAMRASVTNRQYPGGATGLLSDLLFACGYPMTTQNIRNLVSEQRKSLAMQRFEESFLDASVQKR